MIRKWGELPDYVNEEMVVAARYEIYQEVLENEFNEAMDNWQFSINQGFT